MLTITTHSAQETSLWGEALAAWLKPGMVIALSGELGAGKTCLAQGIARGLKVLDQVTSPTFTVINEYQGLIPFYHVDAYRIAEEKEMEELGLEEYFDGDGLTLVEWPERVRTILPPSYLSIHLEKRMDEGGHEYRQIRLWAVGDDWIDVIGALEKDENTRH